MSFSAAGLFSIELLVRFGKQLFDSFAVAAINGDTNTGGELWLLRIAGQDFVNTAGDKVGFGFAGLRQHQGKLVATVASGSIDCATMNPQNVCQAAQGPAANQVAVRVVDFFQSVEIEEQDREGPAIAIGALGFCFEHVEQPPVICQAGERIADGQVLDLLEQSRVIQQ